MVDVIEALHPYALAGILLFCGSLVMGLGVFLIRIYIFCKKRNYNKQEGNNKDNG